MKRAIITLLILFLATPSITAQLSIQSKCKKSDKQSELSEYQVCVISRSRNHWFNQIKVLKEELEKADEENLSLTIELQLADYELDELDEENILLQQKNENLEKVNKSLKFQTTTGKIILGAGVGYLIYRGVVLLLPKK